MLIDTPANTMSLMSSKFDLTEDGTHVLMVMRRNSALFYLENRDAVPAEDEFTKAAATLTEITELEISTEVAKSILSLYPHVRINIAEYGADDCQSDLAFVAAHFFLGCRWPEYRDDVEIEHFVNALKAEAGRMGFVASRSDQ